MRFFRTKTMEEKLKDEFRGLEMYERGKNVECLKVTEEQLKLFGKTVKVFQTPTENGYVEYSEKKFKFFGWLNVTHLIDCRYKRDKKGRLMYDKDKSPIIEGKPAEVK